MMVSAGLDAVSAIRAATGEAAELLGVTDRGVLREGAAADVLVVQGDAVADIACLAAPRHVFQDGRQVV
jgi:imidazolonepropionase-like amidohydrolase